MYDTNQAAPLVGRTAQSRQQRINLASRRFKAKKVNTTFEPYLWWVVLRDPVHVQYAQPHLATKKHKINTQS
jgi:hypothetical protein